VGIREELTAMAELQRKLPDRRAFLVHRARLAGFTWREISIILNITEQGLMKADKSWKERGCPTGD